jgi:hypothetical protein
MKSLCSVEVYVKIKNRKLSYSHATVCEEVEQFSRIAIRLLAGRSRFKSREGLRNLLFSTAVS